MKAHKYSDETMAHVKCHKCELWSSTEWAMLAIANKGRAEGQWTAFCMLCGEEGALKQL